MRVIRTTLSILCALLFSQFPAFETQYELRLQARLSEVQNQLTLFEQAARITGHTLESYTLFFEQQPVREFQESGKIMRKTLERESFLSHAYQRLQQTHYPLKAAVWLSHAERELCRDTWHAYHPCLVLDAPSAGFAATGALIGWLLTIVTSIAIRHAIERRRQKQQKTTS